MEVFNIRSVVTWPQKFSFIYLLFYSLLVKWVATLKTSLSHFNADHQKTFLKKALKTKMKLDIFISIINERKKNKSLDRKSSFSSSICHLLNTLFIYVKITSCSRNRCLPGFRILMHIFSPDPVCTA